MRSVFLYFFFSTVFTGQSYGKAPFSSPMNKWIILMLTYLRQEKDVYNSCVCTVLIFQGHYRMVYTKRKPTYNLAKCRRKRKLFLALAIT